MSLIKWFRTERAWAKVLGRGAYLSRRSVGNGVTRMGGRFGHLFYRAEDSDLHTFWQVFKQFEYDLSPFPQSAAVTRAYEAALAEGKTPVIIDAGANIGAAAIWFETQFPKAIVFAVEPDPNAARLCRMNAQDRKFEVVEAAIGSKPGTVSLETGEQSWATRTTLGGTIPVVTIGDLVGRVQNPRLLMVKVDIEGFESELFSGSIEWLDQTVALFIEPHDWMLPGQGSSRTFRTAIGPEFDMLIAGENLLFIRNEDATPGRAAAPTNLES